MNREVLIDWFANHDIAGIAVANWAFALFVAAVSLVLMLSGLKFALGKMTAIAGRTSNRVDDLIVNVLGGTNRFLLLVIALLIGVGMLDLAPRWSARVNNLWFIALGLQIALWANRGITLGTHHYLSRGSAIEAVRTSASTTLMIWFLRVVLWAVVLLAMLSNLGVNITAFVASLGVGGIAVALAVQNILGDLFASLSIAVDKPFEVGDFIIMGDVMGSVEQVGLKTTRLRSLGGEQIVMSNTELLKNTIRNYKRMAERRVVFGFGVTFDATPEQLAKVPGIIKDIIQSQDKTRFDRAHFKGFGASSLDYEVVYYVLSPDFNLYMDIQQTINLQLMRELDRLDVEFAFPVQTVYLHDNRPAETEERAPSPFRERMAKS
ncbi:MAG: mechanosensitive ion channel family protein [Burkholderiaceae bacterium]